MVLSWLNFCCIAITVSSSMSAMMPVSRFSLSLAISFASAAVFSSGAEVGVGVVSGSVAVGPPS